MRAPRVTVVMPVYNSRPTYFNKTFPALLGQSFGDFELILSDNGSNDEARALYERAAASDDRVRYLRHTHNYGAALNFNYAMAQARGEYFMWSADDDLRAQDYLARTVERLDARRDAVTAGSRVALVDDDGERLAAVRFDPAFELPRPSQRVPIRGPVTPGDYLDIYSLHRRSALARTHLNQAIHGADCLLVRELLLQGPIVRVDEELFFYRQPSSYTMASLAAAMLGSQAIPTLFRYRGQHLALQMLLAVATNDVLIDDAERRATLLALARSLVQQRWLTDEPSNHFHTRAVESWRSGDYRGAAVAMIKAVALDPRKALDVELWQRAARRLAGITQRV